MDDCLLLSNRRSVTPSAADKAPLRPARNAGGGRPGARGHVRSREKRGWVLSQAVAVLAYYTPENNPTLYREAEAWLELVLSERG